MKEHGCLEVAISRILICRRMDTLRKCISEVESSSSGPNAFTLDRANTFGAGDKYVDEVDLYIQVEVSTTDMRKLVSQFEHASHLGYSVYCA